MQEAGRNRKKRPSDKTTNRATRDKTTNRATRDKTTHRVTRDKTTNRATCDKTTNNKNYQGIIGHCKKQEEIARSGREGFG